jgi:glucose-1-phosphate thymidylyltransferase
MQLIGLIPAAGSAIRLAPIPCSKEIFPVAAGPIRNQHGRRPMGCCLYLLEKMELAGARSAYVVIRNGKWDIPAYLGDGSSLGISLAYLMMNAPFGVPFTLDQAYPFVKDAVILFGFPDILFVPKNAYQMLLQHQKDTHADIVLGLFEAREPGKVDMVRLTEDGRIAGIEVKNAASKDQYCWIIALWTPAFTEHLHRFVKKELHMMQRQGVTADPNSEIHIGTVLADAIEAGLTAAPFIFEHSRFLDIGTPENLLKAPAFVANPYGQKPVHKAPNGLI